MSASAIEQELKNRIDVSNTDVLKAALVTIERLQLEANVKGQLLLEVSNKYDDEIGAELMQRINHALMGNFDAFKNPDEYK